ncbi:hypothetical protein ABK040_004243 [Willaertia magna]
MKQQKEKKEAKLKIENKKLLNTIYQLNKKNNDNILFYFPIDLWIKILQFLPTFNILQCQQISLFFYLFINQHFKVYNVENELDIFYNNNNKKDCKDFNKISSKISSRITKYLKNILSKEELEYYHSLLFENIYFGINIKNSDNNNLPYWVNNYCDYYKLCYDSYSYHLNIQNRHSALEYNEMFNYNSDIYLNEYFYLNFIYKYGSYIKFIEFNDCAFVTDRVIKYIKDYCPKLEKLVLNNCMRLSVDFLRLYLFEINHPHFTTLQIIKITNCKCLDDDCFKDYNLFYSCFKNLKEMTYDSYVPFSNWQGKLLDNYFREVLFQNYKLQKGFLNFKSFQCDDYKMNFDSLEKAEEFNTLKLKEEQLVDEFYDNYYFERLYKILDLENNFIYPNLKCLDLGNTIITKISFIDFLLHLILLPNLQTLRLSFAPYDDCNTIFYNEDEMSFLFRQQIFDKIKNHNSLLHLDLKIDYLRLQNVNNFTIIDLMKCFKNLETFNLTIKSESSKQTIKNVKIIEKEEHEIITTFIENHNKLKRLRLNYDYEWVNDISSFFLLIKDNCKDLTILELQGLFKKDSLDCCCNLNNLNNLFENLLQFTIDLNHSEIFTKSILEQIKKNKTLKKLELINGNLQIVNNENIFNNAINNVEELSFVNFTIQNINNNENLKENNFVKNFVKTFGKIKQLYIVDCNNTFNILNALPIMNDLNEIKLVNCNHINVKDLIKIITKENVYKIEKLIIEKTDIVNINEYFEHFSSLILQYNKIALRILKITELNLIPSLIAKIINKCHTHLSALEITVKENWLEIHKELLKCKALRFCEITTDSLLPIEYCEELLDNFPFKGYEYIKLGYKCDVSIRDKYRSIIDTYSTLDVVHRFVNCTYSESYLNLGYYY